MSRKYITVFKVVANSIIPLEAEPQKYRALIFIYIFDIGVNLADNYGFHVFKTQAGAVNWKYSISDFKVVKCKIKRRWIKAIGTQIGHVAYRTSKIVMPPVQDKKAIVG